MKRAHRKAHIGIWLLVTPMMAAIIWLAISVRPGTPVNPSLPSPLIDEAANVP